MAASDYDPNMKPWDIFAKHIFCIWIKTCGHKITDTEEKYCYPDVTTEDGDGREWHWELQMSLSILWENEYTFPYKRPNFVDRKMHYDGPDYIYMVICPSTLAYYAARKSYIKQYGELRRNVPTKGRKGGSMDNYWYLKKEEVYWGSLLITKQ